MQTKTVSNQRSVVIKSLNWLRTERVKRFLTDNIEWLFGEMCFLARRTIKKMIL